LSEVISIIIPHKQEYNTHQQALEVHIVEVHIEEILIEEVHIHDQRTADAAFNLFEGNIYDRQYSI
jgi:hypothetical protein